MRQYLDNLSATLQRIDTFPIEQALHILATAKRNGYNIFVFGNGGSAATASHFVNDLTKISHTRAFSISDMTPTTLAYGNDDGWENMYRNPLKILSAPGDVFVAISCSGKSKNVINAIAFRPPNKIIGLTGDEGGELNRFADVVIKVPHPDIRTQEDAHMAICHALAGKLGNLP